MDDGTSNHTHAHKCTHTLAHTLAITATESSSFMTVGIVPTPVTDLTAATTDFETSIVRVSPTPATLPIPATTTGLETSRIIIIDYCNNSEISLSLSLSLATTFTSSSESSGFMTVSVVPTPATPPIPTSTTASKIVYIPCNYYNHRDLQSFYLVTRFLNT